MVVAGTGSRSLITNMSMLRKIQGDLAHKMLEEGVERVISGMAEGFDECIAMAAIDAINAGKKFPRFYHDHIDRSHYAQMQGSMKILNKQYCDYVVYATSSNLSYVERIEFNPLYWDTILWPGIQKFLNIM